MAQDAQDHARNRTPAGKAPARKAPARKAPAKTDRRFRQWTDEEKALLGQLPDHDIARQLGISHNTVKSAREALGIPRPYVSVHKPAKKPRPPEERDAMLGTMPDAALAREWGVPRHQVANRRRRLGIAGFGSMTPPAGLTAIDGQKVQALRDAKRLTRHALAGQDKTLANYLGLLETGQIRSVRPKTLAKLCALLECQPEQIMTDEDL